MIIYFEQNFGCCTRTAFFMACSLYLKFYVPHILEMSYLCCNLAARLPAFLIAVSYSHPNYLSLNSPIELLRVFHQPLGVRINPSCAVQSTQPPSKSAQRLCRNGRGVPYNRAKLISGRVAPRRLLAGTPGRTQAD